VANVPSDGLTFRRLTLPPAGREVRSRVVREELAFSLPFPLEEAVWDYTADQQDALVVVARRDRIRSLRSQVGDRVDLDAEPLAYLRAALAAGVRSALVMDWGASKTTFCAIEDGRLEWIRVLLRGGLALTAHLAARRGLEPAAAEELKAREGTRLPEVQQWLEELLAEAFLPEPLPYERLLVCGGGAAMPGLLELLEARLGRRPEPFPVPEPLSPYRDVAAYGAALAARPGLPRVHLREPETREAAASGRPAYIFWLALLLALAAVDLELQGSDLERRYTARRQMLAASLQTVAPDLASLPPEEAVPRLRERLQAARQAQLRSPSTFLATLAAMAAPLRQVPGAELRAVIQDGDKITLEGRSANPADAEKVRQALAPLFADLELTNTRPVAGRTVFTLEGKLRQP
jgi:hypothetical protein